jgi:hypothetical protein
MSERDLETMVREQDARCQIYDAIMRWARGVDRNDRELIRAAFHPDGWDEHGAFAGTPADFADWVVDLHLTGYLGTTHDMLNHYVELRGRTAKAETCASVTLRLGHQGTAYEIIGRSRFLDDLEERDGVWRILRRQLLLDHARVVDATDQTPELFGPDAGAPDLVRNMMRGARDHTDPSYAHFGPHPYPPTAG